MNEKLRKLMEQRATAVGKARAILDAAEAENRNLNESEQAQYDGFDAEIDELTTRIQREERQVQREREMQASAGQGNPARQNQPGGAPRSNSPTDTAEYRQNVARYMVSGDTTGLIRDSRGETRSILGMNITTPADGGILAPAVLERTLLDFAQKNYVMRSLASVRTSTSAVEIPYTTGGTKAYHVDEGADFTASKSAIAKVPMGAHKVGALTVVTVEALEDIFIDLEGFVRDEFGKAFADMEEDDFINGDGTKKPRGVLLDATTGVTSASATAITADELLDLQSALRTNFQANATWLMSPATIKLLRKLKTTDGQYLWQPGLQAGQPSMLLGNPVKLSDKMPAAAGGKAAIAYGDFSWYRILDRQGLYFQRLNELYAASGQVGFLAYKRYDAKLLDATAVQVLKMHAG